MMSFDGVRSVSCKAVAWRQARSQGSQSGDLADGHAFAVDRLRKAATWCTILCSFLALFFFVVTPALADEAHETKVRFFFTRAVWKLQMQAAACSGYTSVDTAIINRKLQEYSMAREGLEALDPQVKELRAALSGLSAAESQRTCMDELRKSIDEYAVMRDVFLRRELDKGIPPPVIERETVGLQ
jgi:hypothetical protein